MAKVFGTSARYVGAESVRKSRAVLTVAVCAAWLLGITSGFVLCRFNYGQVVPRQIAFPITILAFVVIVLVWKWAHRNMEALERARLAMRSGLVGENVVAGILARLPDSFVVIHDITARCGNLDHVVIGPTGVFVMDTKNWRGIVSADGKGELLLNGKPTDKAFVRQAVRRTMDTRDMLLGNERLCPDVYFQTLFVFTSARVEAQWGKTGKSHCIRDDQLVDYIAEYTSGRRLTKAEIDRLAGAFLGLARQDGKLKSPAEVAALGGAGNGINETSSFRQPR